MFYHTPWARVRLCAALLVGSLAVGAMIAPPAEALAGERAPRAQRGWLGISMQEATGGKVLIRQVMRTSPAEKAGLRPGDGLLSVHGTPVHSARDTAQAVGQHPPGAVVQVTIERDGKRKVVAVRLEPFPSGEALLRRQHVGQPAPPLQGLRTVVGTHGPTLGDFQGKVLVIDFWASWCIACRATSMHLNRWHERFADRGLEVLGVAAEPPDSVARGARRFQIRYPTCADPDMQTSSAYQVRELPSVMVIDRKGIVRDVTTGHDRRRLREMEALIQRLLDEPAPK